MSAIGSSVDYFEISPDVFCVDNATADGARSLSWQVDKLQDALHRTADHPVVVHGLGLSIGSCDGWDESYLHILEDFARRRPFEWHSEHLSWVTASHPGDTPMHAGLALPLPYTDEALELVVPRAADIVQRYGVPFLLENVTHYLPPLPGEGETSPLCFWSALCDGSGCGILLDLYNLYCDCVNRSIAPADALEEVPLEHVVEIHVAGGAVTAGFLLDVHSRPTPGPVWEMLQSVLPRTPNLRGVTYELLDEAFPTLGLDGLRTQLDTIRTLTREAGR